MMKAHYLKMVRRVHRALRHPRLRHRPWWKKISRPLFHRSLWIPCRDSVASGLAIGLFFSMMLMPFQMIPAALLAMRARGNVPFAMAACWLTNPITTPAVLFFQFRLGHWMREALMVPMPGFLSHVHFDVNAGSYLLGMMTSGVMLALLAYPLVHLFSAILPQHLPVRPIRLRKPFSKVGVSPLKMGKS